jgi:Fe-S-cluster containining protein
MDNEYPNIPHYEFTMNAFTPVLALESSRAAADLKSIPPRFALIRFYKRLDDAIALATHSTTGLACEPGCFYCCHLSVQVSAIEAIAIAHYVATELKPNQIKDVIARATKNADELMGLDELQRLAANQSCAFLHQCNCSIYPVRPSECRKYHSTDVQVCIGTYEQPLNNEIPVAYCARVFEAGIGMKQGFQVASNGAGFDQREYDLNSAFLDAVRSAVAEKRYKTGKRALPTARVVLNPK